MKRAKECKHRNFWFDRSLSYCVVHDDMEMAEVCSGCGKTRCDLEQQEEK